MPVRFGDEAWPDDTEILRSVGSEIDDEDLAGLRALPGLVELRLLDTDRHRRIVHPITDLSPLADLPELRVLELPRSTVEDLSPLRALKQLRRLDVSRTRVADVSPLADLPLTNAGEAQARAVGEKLAGRRFALVLTSPALKQFAIDYAQTHKR